MANMRVHELAKELNITSKDITDMLSNSEKTYKSVSGLTDEEVMSVRKKFAPAPKNESKPAVQQSDKPKQAEIKQTENKQAESKPAADRQNSFGNKPQQTQGQNSQQNSNQNRQNGKTAEDKKHISQVYFPQNSSKDRNKGRDNQNRNDRNNGGYQNRDNNGGFRNDRNNGEIGRASCRERV